MYLLINPNEKVAVPNLFTLESAFIGIRTFGESIPLRIGIVDRNPSSDNLRYWNPRSLSSYTIRAAIGNPSLNPIGGTFTLTYDGDTTDPIAYDATAVQVAAELNGLASIVSAGGVTVSSPGTGFFIIMFTADGVRTALTSDPESLVPESRAIVSVHITGDVDTAEVKHLRLFQEPAAFVALALDTYPDTDPMGEIEVLAAGGTGVNMEFRVTLYEYAYAGTWSILWDGGNVDIIVPFGATAEEVEAAIEEVITPETASVVKEANGSYLVTIEDGTDHTATLAIGTGDLQIIRHYIGDLSLQSLGMEILTASGDAELYFEVEAAASGDDLQKVFREPITITNPVIDYRYIP